MLELEMETFEIENTIRGDHVYKVVWSPTVGETLPLVPESNNSHDEFAFSIERDDVIVGHAL